ncbi:methyltransferase domain-containing protein [Falsiroseomonas selenitidurans]|uniref:Methyltransferase domain-containing protein n=1 Tax=Falsiroseomonas selenitidurans TaxID=2716335 RepID=A0ABX1DZH7_9PROT|nr:methyltransferase domain-containing protein [Falsiroseomonas selenitidurans]NKC30246.1 methyltransferase domain-containing protein [Falsiroseomonas selenitidurans]
MTSAVSGQIEFEHLHRYCIARDLADGRDVLDVASGEGYGAALLAGLARSVTGVELDAASVAHAQRNYARAGLRFLCADAQALPLADASFDLVVCFETLEHLPDQARFLAEVRRVLRPGGLFLVSTPERMVYSAAGAAPNPFHVLELTEPEFGTLLARHFAASRVLRQRPMLGSVVAAGHGWRSYERRSPDIIEATGGLARPHYLLGLAGDGALPVLPSSAYLDRRRVHDVVEDAARLPQAEAASHRQQAEGDAARAEAAALRERLPQAEAALRAAEQAAAAALAEAARLARDLAALETTLVAERQAREAAEASQRRTLMERDEARRGAAAGTDSALRQAREAARIDQARQAAEAHARLHAVQQAREAAEAHVVHLIGMLEQIHRSTGWRALGPLRWLGRRHPRTARWLGRGAKLLWWTATLQIGHRAMQWRRHRAAQRAQREAPPPAPALPPAPPAPAEARPVIAAPPTLPSLSPPIHGLGAPPPPPRRDLQAEFFAAHGDLRIAFPAVEAPDVSVIIPAWRGLADLETCLRALVAAAADGPTFEVVLVDDDPSQPVLPQLPDSPGLLRLANAANLGFLRSCNRGAAAARGRHLCFLNSDTIVQPDWLAALVATAEGVPQAGLVGGMLLNRDGTVQDAGWRILGNGWGYPIGRGASAQDGAYTYRRPVDCVTGACLLLPRAVFAALDGFDEAYAPAFYEEFDLAFRARARGLSVIYAPACRVVHLGSASYGAAERDRLSLRNHATFVARFADQLRKHPWDRGDAFELRHAAGEGPLLLVADHAVPRPDRHAGDVTIARYLGLMAAAGWRVAFAPMDGVAEGPAAEALEAQGIELVRAPRTAEDWLEAHGRHLRAAWLARPDVAERLLGPVRRHSSAMLAYYTHDLHHQRLRREATLRDDPALHAEADRVAAQEIAIFREVDRVTTPSEAEAALIRTLAPGREVVAIPPYFFEEAEIRAHDAAHFEPLRDIVFVGGFPHTPNVDAALMLANEVMPEIWQEEPAARLVLVGYAPPPAVQALAGPRVVVTGHVPAVEPFLAAARLFLAPLRFGAGVKGKVVQALQNGVPVVTSAVGAEGIGIEPGQEALVEESASALAAAALALLRDPARCAALSEAGATLVRRRFTCAAGRHAAARVFDTPRCPVCGSARLAPTEGPEVREAIRCQACYALGRSQAVAQVLLSRLAVPGVDSLAEWSRQAPGIRLHEFGFVGGIADTLRGWPGYACSEFIDGVAPGECGPQGIRCEDLTRLTYPDAQFDMLLSQDVLEHVPDPARAFAESFRVLRPGGSHLFTVPQDRDLRHSVTRARLGPAGVEHLLPPAFHGDPLRAEGALVFTDFGLDLPEIVQAAGFEMLEHAVTIHGSDLPLRVFEARRPAAVAG